MDAVEKAIRNALEKGDAGDRAFREKVYRSAFAALERSIRAKPDMADEEAERRRRNLKHGITQIESEFVPASAARQSDRAGHATNEEPGGYGGRPAVQPAEEPGVGRHHGGEDADAAGGGVPDAAIDAVVADERGRRMSAHEPRSRSRVGLLTLVILIIAVVAGAVWWAIAGGPAVRQTGDQEATVDDILREQSGGDVSTDDAGGDGSATVPDEDWITVFSPADATAIAASPGAEAQIREGEEEPFVRLMSREPNAALRFDVGQGVLEALSGSGIVFSIVARAEEGEETEMSVSCDIGALGDCGRKRYVVGATRSEYLLEVETGGGAPNAGTITIVPDISGEGRAVDIFGIRASRATR